MTVMQRFRRMRPRRGMTLIELIVAFSILLLLTSMAVPLARYRVRRQKEVELRVSLREITTAIPTLIRSSVTRSGRGFEA